MTLSKLNILNLNGLVQELSLSNIKVEETRSLVSALSAMNTYGVGEHKQTDEPLLESSNSKSNFELSLGINTLLVRRPNCRI